MKIFLVGLPGSGKTTLGRQLSERLGIPFIDLDVEIERKEGKSIREMFLSDGEPYFRQKEAEALREFAGSTGDFVMATGGGAPCFYEGIKTINEHGLSLFLDVPVVEIVGRVSKDTNRPLLEAQGDREKRLNELLAQRIGVYRQAHLTVTGTSVTVDDLLKKINLKK